MVQGRVCKLGLEQVYKLGLGQVCRQVQELAYILACIVMELAYILGIGLPRNMRRQQHNLKYKVKA